MPYARKGQVSDSKLLPHSDLAYSHHAVRIDLVVMERVVSMWLGRGRPGSRSCTQPIAKTDGIVCEEASRKLVKREGGMNLCVGPRTRLGQCAVRFVSPHVNPALFRSWAPRSLWIWLYHLQTPPAYTHKPRFRSYSLSSPSASSCSWLDQLSALALALA